MAHIKPLFGLITSFRMRLSQKIFFLLNLLVFLHAQESKTNPTKENDVKDQSVNWIRDYYQYKVNNLSELEVNIDYSMGELYLDANKKSKSVNAKVSYNSKIVEANID